MARASRLRMVSLRLEGFQRESVTRRAGPALSMQLGMIGLGRMGANMVGRLAAAGHECIVYDAARTAVEAVVQHRVSGAASIEALAAALAAPRVVWLMVPSGAVDAVLEPLTSVLASGDVIVDGGNSHYAQTMRRARSLAERGLCFVDVGTSGGVWGRELGYCQMIGGEVDVVGRLEPLFDALANGARSRAAYLHCGPSGAGHFVQMVHNGIEYGLMQAYAEGLSLLEGASASAADEGNASGVDLDVAAITELWRHGSVVRSWLLDLTAAALASDPKLERFEGAVSDSGEGRWMLETAIERGVPVPALAAALFARFSSRGNARYGDRALSAMRQAFGGHVEPDGD